METLLFIQQLVILLFSTAIHEVSHAIVADSLGDDTAARQGRITLNPLVHLDLYGSIVIPLMLLFAGGPVIGSAKPVPVRFERLKPQRLGMIMVSLAGPFSNLALALVFAILLRFIPLGTYAQISLFQAMVINVSLGVFNLFPIPPLDGSKVILAFFKTEFAENIMIYEKLGFLLLILLLMTPVFQIVYSPVRELFIQLAGLST